jgi:hypothetical protein
MNPGIIVSLTLNSLYSIHKKTPDKAGVKGIKFN